MNNDFHEQVEIMTNATFPVDEKLADIVLRINNSLGIGTYESCQNYGEYLRKLGFMHVDESKRDYAYIEFFDGATALNFVHAVLAQVGPGSVIHHKIKQEATPGAWELKARLSLEPHFWVWFPSEDIPELESILNA